MHSCVKEQMNECKQMQHCHADRKTCDGENQGYIVEFSCYSAGGTHYIKININSALTRMTHALTEFPYI